MNGEQTGWLPDNRPPLDTRPIETGGAVVVFRLTPDEVERLAAWPTLMDAIHALIATVPTPREAAEVSPLPPPSLGAPDASPTGGTP